MTVRGRVFRRITFSVLMLWLATLLWQLNKPLPAGVHVASAPMTMPSQELHFLYDLTWRDAVTGQRRSEQHIFDAVLAQIDAAEHFIVLDYFLLNVANGSSTAAPLRALSGQLVDHLLARQRARPSLQILLITDPINDAYGGAPSPLLMHLQSAGVQVVRTDLQILRDSNAGYSALWRVALQWLGNSDSGGWLPNPFDAHSSPITLRSWLSLLNFKANHRKVIISDRADGEWLATVASANPHDASSAHSNVALQFSGEAAASVLNSEIQIARQSGWTGEWHMPARVQRSAAYGDAALTYVTEGAIHDRVLADVAMTQAGDAIDLAMFYLSDRDVIDALKAAAKRGVQLRLILDPNKDAFGIEKDGVPNRPVAQELLDSGSRNITLRWYATHGEQFHTKLLLVRHAQRLFVTLGSANFTRRNLEDYNLEANVALQIRSSDPLAVQFQEYFTRIWQGDALNARYTLPAATYSDDSWLRYWRYRLMEATGLSTF